MKKKLVVMIVSFVVFSAIAIIIFKFLLNLTIGDATIAALITSMITLIQPFIIKYINHENGDTKPDTSQGHPVAIENSINRIHVQEQGYRPELGYYIGIDFGRYKIDSHFLHVSEEKFNVQEECIEPIKFKGIDKKRY